MIIIQQFKWTYCFYNMMKQTQKFNRGTFNKVFWGVLCQNVIYILFHNFCVTVFFLNSETAS